MADKSYNTSDVPDIYLPVKQLIKVDKRYIWTDGYKNLYMHRFTENERFFLCECYESGASSKIGTTSNGGMSRLTLAGIQKRYKIREGTFRSWLKDYREYINLNSFDNEAFKKLSNSTDLLHSSSCSVDDISKIFDHHDDEHLCVSTSLDDERQLLSDEYLSGDVGGTCSTTSGLTHNFNFITSTTTSTTTATTSSIVRVGSDMIVTESDSFRTTTSTTATSTTSTTAATFTTKEVENLIGFSTASIAKNSSNNDNDLSQFLQELQE